ncbi:MAG: hypothetical protein ACRD1U_15065 [Vicinamibacterales bacterium]
MTYGVMDPVRKKPDIDVMENVFGGVHISTEDEVRDPAPAPEIRARPWLAGLTLSAVQVTLAADEESESKKREP